MDQQKTKPVNFFGTPEKVVARLEVSKACESLWESLGLWEFVGASGSLGVRRSWTSFRRPKWPKAEGRGRPWEVPGRTLGATVCYRPMAVRGGLAFWSACAIVVGGQ
jgi:hypothetical protein